MDGYIADVGCFGCEAYDTCVKEGLAGFVCRIPISAPLDEAKRRAGLNLMTGQSIEIWGTEVELLCDTHETLKGGSRSRIVATIW